MKPRLQGSALTMAASAAASVANTYAAQQQIAPVPNANASIITASPQQQQQPPQQPPHQQEVATHSSASASSCAATAAATAAGATDDGDDYGIVVVGGGDSPPQGHEGAQDQDDQAQDPAGGAEAEYEEGSSRGVVESVEEAVQEGGAERAVEVVGMLRHEDWQVRMACCAALGDARLRLVGPMVGESDGGEAGGGDGGAPQRGVKSLVLRPLVALLEVEKMPQVRVAIITTLGLLGDMRALAILEHLKVEGDLRVRVEAENAVNTLSMQATSPVPRNDNDISSVSDTVPLDPPKPCSSSHGSFTSSHTTLEQSIHHVAHSSTDEALSANPLLEEDDLSLLNCGGNFDLKQKNTVGIEQHSEDSSNISTSDTSRSTSVPNSSASSEDREQPPTESKLLFSQNTLSRSKRRPTTPTKTNRASKKNRASPKTPPPNETLDKFIYGGIKSTSPPPQLNISNTTSSSTGSTEPPPSLVDPQPQPDQSFQYVSSHTKRNLQPLSSRACISNTTKRSIQELVQSAVPALPKPIPRPYRRLIDFSVLSAGQKKALDIAFAGQSFFFTGAAGTGKSFLLRILVEELRARHPPDTVFVTASTGIAACNIGGVTLHSFAGIGLGDGATAALITKVKKNTNARRRWKDIHVLVIDEVSMLSGEFFDKLDAIAKEVRHNDKPFGGIQVILCGDFFQLPPVFKGTEQLFCFESMAWKALVTSTVELVSIYRQKESNWIKILNEVRLGAVSRESWERLKKCIHQILSTADGIEPTRLCPMRAEAAAVNTQKLSQIPGAEHTFQAIDKAENDIFLKVLSEHTAPTKLILKEKSQVVLLRNIDPDVGLVNGATGVVTGFDAEGFPVVQFKSVTRSVCREEWNYQIGDQILASRSQVPLQLAWALSIHRSQGMTLEKVEMSLRRVFAPGQVYVALSRVTSLEGVSISDGLPDPSLLKPHIKVQQFYSTMVASST